MHASAVAESLSKIQLKTGSHVSPAFGLCVMECVAFVAGERHSYQPTCVCPIITQVAMYANDNQPASVLPQLAERVLRLAGSRASAEVESKRASFLVDFVIRKALPVALGVSALPACAALVEELNALAPIVATTRTFAARTLVTTIPYEARLGATRGIGGLRASCNLECMLDALRHGHYRQSTTNALDLLEMFGTEVDYPALLDNLLDIGGTPALKVTEPVAARIATLANLAE